MHVRAMVKTMNPFAVYFYDTVVFSFFREKAWSYATIWR